MGWMSTSADAASAVPKPHAVEKQLQQKDAKHGMPESKVRFLLHDDISNREAVRAFILGRLALFELFCFMRQA